MMTERGETPVSDSAPERFTIARALGVLRGHKRLATVVFLAVLAGATTFVISLPNVYSSTATVLVEHPGTAEGAGKSLIAVELETRLQTIGQEVLSKTRLLALMDQFDLYPDLKERGAVDAALERLRQEVQVRLTKADTSRKTTVAFSISFRSRHPGTAAHVANALAAFYIEENAKSRERQGSAARLARLSQELAQMQEVYTARYPDVIRLKAEIAALGQEGAKPSLAVGEEFRILDPATPARSPAAPQRIGFLVLGIGLAIGAAAAAVTLVELFEPSFHLQEELQAFTTVPVLAGIPYINTGRDQRRHWQSVARIAVGLAIVVFVSYHLANGNDQLAWLLSRSAAR